MRKGFLLADKKEKKRTQVGNVGDSKILLRDGDYERRHNETTPQTNGASGLSMKQGFLLRSSSAATRRKCNQQRRVGDSTKASNLLPQCTVNKNRVVTATSAALLDVENSMDKTEGNGAQANDDIVSSPSLIKIIASSVESTCSGDNDHGEEDVIDCKQQPIIVESDDRPVTIIAEENIDNAGLEGVANDNNVCREENNSVYTSNEMDSFAFANEVSQLLSRLRRTLKSNKQSKRNDVTNDALIGVRQFMNQKSEQLIKTFVEKHIHASIEKGLRLRQLWTLILEQIAQESTASSRKKKKSTNSISSPLALGVGVLQFSKPIGLALGSIASVLSSLTSSIVQPISCDDTKQKRYKIEAIGAILLIQCHFRCMSIEASEEHTAVNATNKFERIEMETSMLLNKIIPALQSIVINGQKRTFLSATAADAFFELIEIFPRVESSGINASTPPNVIWKDILPRIEKMIDVKRRWMTKNDEGVTSSKIRATPTLFCNVSCQVILPPVLEYMSHRYTTSNVPSSTSISCLLCDVMKANAIDHADDFVGCLVLSAQQLETWKVIFEKNGEIWKSSLLESDEASAYRNILMAAAKSMVGMPSSTIPLSLFSCLVDTTNDVDVTDSERKILVATVSVIRFAVGELRLCRDFDTEDEQLVFKRFSPLLILRRLPKAYYQSLHKHIVSDTESSRTVMCELATELATGLRAHALKNDERNLAREEKALLAQVAGHCLPFSVTPDVNDSPIALFDLCKKPFYTTLDILRTKSKTSLGLQNIRESKAVLFAVCQHILAANDEDISGNALINVASFVLDVLLESQTTCGDETERELTKLHTVCLHFLGVVFDSLFARKAKKSTEPQIKSDGHNCRNEFLGGLIMVFDMTTSVVFNGAIDGGLVHPKCHASNALLQSHDKQRFAASTRTSIFNSMVIFSQSCTTEDQRLALFASELLPTLLKWVDEGPVDDDIRHPLCIAASLQVVYTIFARIGSFDWVTNFCNESEADFVRLTLRCALSSLCGEEGGNIVSPLRLAALKVILTVVAIQPKESGQNLAKYLEPVEVRHAVALVRGAANRDQSQEVRRLAFEILLYLEHIVDSS